MDRAMIIQTIEENRALIKSSIELLRAEADKHVTEYWDAWKERNRIEIKAPHDSGVFKNTYLGSFAPKVTMIGDAKKITVHWHQYKPYKSKAPSFMSVRVMPKKSGKYTKSCFKNHAHWEWEMIEKTESLIKPYRDMLEHYHEMYIELGTILRQLAKQ